MHRLIALVAAAAALLLAPAAAGAQAPPERGLDVLVFSKTAGFRHASIEPGIAAVRALGRQHGFRVRATEDASVLTARRLRGLDVLLFLNTTGIVLEDRQRRAIERYMRGGGGFVGVHSAADTEYGWSFYERLVGVRFFAHPVVQPGTLVNEDRRNPATAHLARRFEVTDEFYSFQRNPRPRVHVLLSIDEATYEQDPNTTYVPGDEVDTSTGVMGDHPMSWCHDLGDGRAFYTALGHEPQLYRQRWFRRHLLGGIRTAARAVEADCSPRRR